MTVVGNAIFILCMYFLPALISALHWHHNQNAIFLTNLFFGWTVIGWVAALIWCTTSQLAVIKRATPNTPVTRAWIDAALFV
jgi:hypothetical protein